jgi:hypothetical protein
MEDIVKEAREAIALSHEFDRDNRREAMEDLRFVAGDQWSEKAKTERKGRPIITINRSSQFLRQVSNPIRSNMPTIKVEPDGKDDLQGAEVFNGLLRRIQYNSSASHVYASAVEHMVACGIGWFRVVTDYLDDDSFDQELMIKRIFNPLSVYADPSSLEPDRSTMNWCLVSEMIPKKTFEILHPGKATTSVDSPSDGSTVAWGSADNVRRAEYWRRKEVPKTIARLKDGQTVNITDMPKRQLEQLKAMGMIEATREAKGYKVEMQLVSGAEVLSDVYECPCRWIPIVPVVGAEVPLEQGIYRHGLIRFQREPQQLQNYMLSKIAEVMGQQANAPYMVTPQQIGKFKNMWDNANTTPTNYLLHENGTERPQREPPAPFPAAYAQLAQMMEDFQKSVTGQYDASLGARSNETSGVAIQGRIEQGNQATSHFVDNLEHSLEHTGRILLDMIPKIYDTARTIRMKSDDGSETEAQINQPTIGVDGMPQMVNDLSQMKFSSVRVIMGPSYASRRQEAVQVLTNLIQAMPQIGEIGGDIIARNLDFDGSEELAERLRAILPPQILQLQQAESGQPPPEPPQDPMAEMQMQGQQQAMQTELQAGQSKAAQEDAKAAQERAKAQQEELRVQSVELDNALKFKKLREPSPHHMAENEPMEAGT